MQACKLSERTGYIQKQKKGGYDATQMRKSVLLLYWCSQTMDGNTFGKEIWTSFISNESWAQTIFVPNAFRSKCFETIRFYRTNFMSVVVCYAVDITRGREYTTFSEMSKLKTNSQLEAAFLNVSGKYFRLFAVFMKYSQFK